MVRKWSPKREQYTFQRRGQRPAGLTEGTLSPGKRKENQVVFKAKTTASPSITVNKIGFFLFNFKISKPKISKPELTLIESSENPHDDHIVLFRGYLFDGKGGGAISHTEKNSLNPGAYSIDPNCILSGHEKGGGDIKEDLFSAAWHMKGPLEETETSESDPLLTYRDGQPRKN